MGRRKDNLSILTGAMRRQLLIGCEVRVGPETETKDPEFLIANNASNEGDKNLQQSIWGDLLRLSHVSVFRSDA